MKPIRHILSTCTQPNMNKLDRGVRFTLGLALTAISPMGYGLLGDDIIGWFFALFGIANIISSLIGWCFMYSLVGLTSLAGSDDDQQNIELDFASLRKKAIIGFGTVSVLISAFFISEGYQSSKETVQSVELNHLHSNAIYVINDVEHILDSDSSTAATSNALLDSGLLNKYFLADTPIFIALLGPDGSWVLQTKNSGDSTFEQILNALKNRSSEFAHNVVSNQNHSSPLYDLKSLHKHYLSVGDQQYAVVHHDITTSKSTNVRLFIGEQSQTEAVLDRVLTRMVVSSSIVIWIAIWGAVAVAYFIWKYVEGSNRRAINAANTDSRTGLLNERALREIFSNNDLIQPSLEYTVYAAKFRNLSQILANNSSIILSQVLHQLATRIKNEITSDTIVGCLNDSTFIIVARPEQRDDINHFKRLINETQHLDNYRFSLEPTEVELSYPNDVSDFENLLSSISTLIYYANHQRLAYLRYQDDLIQNSQKTSKYSSELKTAIETKQFELYLQPKIDMTTGEVLGGEALIRWNHPQDGLLTPYHFLDLVEQSNMRSAFALFVVNEVCSLTTNLPSKGYLQPLSFNLNGYDVFDPSVIEALESVSQQLSSHQYIMPEIELTESETAIDVERIATQLHYISSLGFNIALDDFGTGMSSFSYSHALPINTIKIDRSFVLDLDESSKSHIPIRAILFLAKNYGYEVVVEGVETQQQVDILTNLGCAVCQGYFYSTPVTYTEFIAMLPESKQH